MAMKTIQPISLENEVRLTLPTAEAAYHLNRANQRGCDLFVSVANWHGQLLAQRSCWESHHEGSTYSNGTSYLVCAT